MSGLVAVGSVKGAPGVTTTTVGLAAGWPVPPGGAPVIAVEADPAGGDVAGWYGPEVVGGLVTWAAQARSGRPALAGHVRELPGGVEVVAAPVEAAAAGGAVAVLADSGAVRAAANTMTLLVDVGRLEVSSPAQPLLAVCDVLLVVARPRPVELARIAAREGELTAAGRRECLLLLIGQPAWPVDRVAASVGLPVLGVLPDDRRAAEMIAGRRGTQRGLARAYQEVAGAVAGLLRDRPLPLPPQPAAGGLVLGGAPGTPADGGGREPASRTATVLVPGTAGGAPQAPPDGGWVPSTTVRGGARR